MIVWLASYPRSGNTFFRVVLNSVFGIKTYSIYDDRNDIGANKETSKIVGHEFLPPDFDLDKARESQEIFYIKTHELLENIDLDKSDRVIYLVRDGRESSLSFAKYMQDFHEKNDDSLLKILLGETSFGSWGEHVRQWKNADKIVIKFEDLISNPSQVATIIAKYLNINPINNKIPTFDELHAINPRFFRSGKKDSWKENFSEAESWIFWGNSLDEMINLEYREGLPSEFSNLSFKKMSPFFEKNNNLISNLLKERSTAIKGFRREIKLIEKKLYLYKKNIKNLSKNIRKKDNTIKSMQGSKSFRIGNLFFRSIKNPWKMITFPINLLRILIKKVENEN